MDHDRVRIRYVDPIFDDFRRYEYVVFVVAEVDEDLLHLFRSELSMSDGDTCIRDFSLDKSCEILYVINTAIDEVDLSISTHLKANRLSDNLWGHLCEDGLDGSTISWRGVEVG